MQNQAKAAEKYNLLKDEKLKLELDKAILFSMEAKNNRDGLQKKLDGLKRDLKIKNAESDTYQSQIDQYRTENESVLNEYENAQKTFMPLGLKSLKERLTFKISLSLNQKLKII